MNEQEENREIRRKIDQGVRLAIAEAVRENNRDSLREIFQEINNNNLDVKSFAEEAAIAKEIAGNNWGLALRRRKEFLNFLNGIKSLTLPTEELTFDDLLNDTESLNSQVLITSQLNACFLLGFISLEALMNAIAWQLLLYDSSNKLKNEFTEVGLIRQNNHSKEILDIFEIKFLKEDWKWFRDNRKKSKDNIEMYEYDSSFQERFKKLIIISFKCSQGNVETELLKDKWASVKKLVDIRNYLTHSKSRPKIDSNKDKLTVSSIIFSTKEEIEELNNLYKWYVSYLWQIEFIRPLIHRPDNGKSSEIPLASFTGDKN